MVRLRHILSVSALASALGVVPALGQEALRLRGGEHGDYSRMVIDAPKGTAFEWGVEGRKLVVLFPQRGGGVDVSGAQGRGLKRVAGLSAREEAGGSVLEIEMNCDCGANAITLGDGRIVLDVKPGAARPAPPSFQSAATPARNEAPAPPPRPSAGATAEAEAEPEPEPEPDAETPSADPSPAPPAEPSPPPAAEETPEAPEENGVAAAMRRAAEQLGRLIAQRDEAEDEEAQPPAPAADPSPALPEETVAPAPVVEAQPAEPPTPPASDPPAPPDAQPTPAPEPTPPSDVAQDAPEAETDPEEPSLSLAAEDAIAEARRRLLDQLAKAAGEGLLNVRDPEAVQEMGDQPGLEDVAAALSDAPIKARTASEIARQAAADRRRHALPPPHCLPDSALNMISWADDAPAALNLSAARRELVGEFDAARPNAVLSYIKLLLNKGFGVEALSAMDAFAGSVEMPPELRDLARIVEQDLPAPAGPLRNGLDCEGFHLGWATAIAAMEDELDIAALDIEALRPAISRLPDHMRAAMIVPISHAALKAGDLYKAEALAGLAALTEAPWPDSDGRLEVLMARIDHARGNWRRAERRLAPIIAADTPAGVDARLALVDSRLDRDAAPPAGLAEEMEALAFIQGDSRLGRRLFAAAARSRARTDGLGPALAALNALAEHAGDRAAAMAGARDMLVDYEPTRESTADYAEVVLKNWHLVGDGPEGDGARVAVARRLELFGLGRLAEELLAPAIARGEPSARIAAADAATEAGFPQDALNHLGGLDDVAAHLSRARAHAALGDYAAAAEDATRAGDAELAARFGWLAGDWRLAAAAGEADKRIFSAWMAGEGDPPEELRALAENDPALAERLWAFSADSNTAPAPDEADFIGAATRALQAARRQRELLGEILRDG